MVHRRRKWLRRGILLAFALVVAAALAVRFYAVPQLQLKLAEALHSAGYPEAQAQMDASGITSLGLVVRLQPDAEPVVEARLWPWSLQTLRATSVRLRLPVGGGGEAGPWWQVPLPVPVLPWRAVVLDDVTVQVADGVDITGRLMAVPAPEGGWTVTADYALPAQDIHGTGRLALAPDGRYTLTADGRDAAGRTVVATLEAGGPTPTVSAQISAPGVVSLSLNPAHKPGLEAPVTAEISCDGCDLKAAGTVDLLSKRQATLMVTGAIKRPEVDVRGLMAVLHIASLWPLVIPDGQKVDAAAVQAGGFPLTTLRARVGWQEGKLRVQSAEALALGGTIAVKPLELTLPPRTVSATVTLDNLDLSQALVLAGVDGLSGVGRLSGTVPISYADGKLTIGDGTLAALEAGSIAYLPAEPPAFLAEGGQGALLAQVFSDFHYNVLNLNLEGTPGDTLVMKARIEGSNPAFYNAHPVAFNLTLSGPLDAVLKQGLKGLKLSPEALRGLMQDR